MSLIFICLPSGVKRFSSYPRQTVENQLGGEGGNGALMWRVLVW